MERKNFLKEELSKEEKLYLKKMILNARRRYIRDNYDHINHTNIDFYDCIGFEAESVLDTVIRKCEEDIKSAVEFEKILSNKELQNAFKVLSLNEKMVLFLLYKKTKSINEIALEMKMDRTTIWRLKNKAMYKILKKLLGGNKNV